MVRWYRWRSRTIRCGWHTAYYGNRCITRVEEWTSRCHNEFSLQGRFGPVGQALQDRPDVLSAGPARYAGDGDGVVGGHGGAVQEVGEQVEDEAAASGDPVGFGEVLGG